MRIIITSNYRQGNETGTARVAEKLSTFLAKRHQVTYICLGKEFRSLKINKRLTILELPSIEINSMAIPLITPDIVYKVFHYLHEFKPDVTHSQNSLFISNLVQIWANLNNIPFIVTFHHIPTQAVEHLAPTLKGSLFSDIVQDLYKNLSLKKFLINTDAVIALNKFVYQSIRKVDTAVPIKIINNGLDLAKLLAIRLKSKPPTNIRFIFLGSYNERKNQSFLIETFRFLPKNWTLNLYGNKKTNKPYVDSLKDLITQSNLSNISINDFESNIVNVFKDTDFFISTSLKEAQSLVIVESLASGKPVIGLENETVLELVNKNNGLLCSKKITPREFAFKISNFIESCDYKELSKKARGSINKFKIEKVVSKIEDVYKSTTYSNRQNGRRYIAKYYQEIFKTIIVKK